LIEATSEELGLLSISIQEDVASGALEVAPREQWWGAKPVVRNSKTKRLVKGSGKIAGSKDPVAVGKETAFRRSTSYRDAVESLISVDNPEAKYSFESLIDALWKAVNGESYQVDCPHPEDCEDGGKHMIGRKTDTATAFKLYENLAGKAKETKEVKTEETSIHMLLEKREHRVILHEVEEDEAEVRRRRVLEMIGDDVDS